MRLPPSFFRRGSWLSILRASLAQAKSDQQLLRRPMAHASEVVSIPDPTLAPTTEQRMQRQETRFPGRPVGVAVPRPPRSSRPGPGGVSSRPWGSRRAHLTWAPAPCLPRRGGVGGRTVLRPRDQGAGSDGALGKAGQRAPRCVLPQGPGGGDGSIRAAGGGGRREDATVAATSGRPRGVQSVQDPQEARLFPYLALQEETAASAV